MAKCTGEVQSAIREAIAINSPYWLRGACCLKRDLIDQWYSLPEPEDTDIKGAVARIVAQFRKKYKPDDVLAISENIGSPTLAYATLHGGRLMQYVSLVPDKYDYIWIQSHKNDIVLENITISQDAKFEVTNRLTDIYPDSDWVLSYRAGDVWGWIGQIDSGALKGKKALTYGYFSCGVLYTTDKSLVSKDAAAPTTEFK